MNCGKRTGGWWWPALLSIATLILVVGFETHAVGSGGRRDIYAKKRDGAKKRGDRKTGGAPQGPANVSRPDVRGELARAWEAFYAGDYKEAVKTVAPVAAAVRDRMCAAGDGDLALRRMQAEAEHLMARCYWVHGEDRSRTEARRMWDALAKFSDLNANVQRQVIARALMFEEENQADQAIRLLESVLERNWADTCTPEAAIELARLQVRAGRFDEARRVLDFALAFLKRQKTREISALSAGPFAGAAKRAKGRLKYDADAGRECFEKAEALRRKGRFAEAAKGYREVMKEFPATEYAIRSDLYLGHCLAGLGKTAAALAHWEAFIASSPSGPWRGQAYVAVADVHLEERGDPAEGGKYAAMGAAAIVEGLRDPKARVSWEAVAISLHLRDGIAAYLQSDTARAGRAFEHARRMAAEKKHPVLAKALDRLVRASEAGQPILPADVGAGDGEVPRILSIGVLYGVARDFARAGSLFDRVLEGKVRASPAQRAFASFGKATVLEERKRTSEARKAYEASLRMLAAGTWHDETLYRLAMLIHRGADAKFGKAMARPEGAEEASRSPAEQAQQESERRKRAAELAGARAVVLLYWSDLIARYPESPRLAPALQEAGRLLTEAGRCEEGVAFLGRYVSRFPKAPRVGEAYVRLIEVCLETLFNFPAAAGHASAAVAWAKETGTDEGAVGDEAPVLPLWASAEGNDPLGEKALGALRYKVYVRAGVVAYLDQKYEAATALFEAAEPLAPPREFVVVTGRIPTAIERMIAAARARKKLTPDEVLAGDPNAKLILQLADIYHHCGEQERAIALCDRVIDTKENAPTPLQRSWAHNRKAASLYMIPNRRDLKTVSKQAYLAAVKACPQAPWAPKALFYAGTITNNFEQNLLKVAEIFKDVVRRYPKSDIADKAAYFIGVVYETKAQYAQAKGAYEDFLKRYPASKWADVVRDRHLKYVESQIAAGASAANGRKRR